MDGFDFTRSRPSRAIFWLLLFDIVSPGMSTTANTNGDVLFQRIGDTVHTLEYANIRIPIHLAAVHDVIFRLKVIIIKHSSYWEPGHGGFHSRALLEDEVDRLLYRCDLLKTLLSDIPYNQGIHRHSSSFHISHSRPKRFIFTLLLLGVFAAITAGSLYSLFKHGELQTMRHNVNTLAATSITHMRKTQSVSHNQQELAALVNKTITLVQTQRHTVRFTGIETAASGC